MPELVDSLTEDDQSRGEYEDADEEPDGKRLLGAGIDVMRMLFGHLQLLCRDFFKPTKAKYGDSGLRLRAGQNDVLGPLLPEPEVKDKQDGSDHSRPEDRLLKYVSGAVMRNDGRAVDQPGELCFRRSLRHVADHDGDDHAHDPRPQRAIEVGRHCLHADDGVGGRVWLEDHEADVGLVVHYSSHM